MHAEGDLPRGSCSCGKTSWLRQSFKPDQGVLTPYKPAECSIQFLLLQQGLQLA